MARIFVTQPLLPGSLSTLVDAGHDLVIRHERSPISRRELLEHIGDVEGLICLLCDRIDDEILAAAPHLRVVANVAVGLDNIDLDAARRRGITVCNTPGVLDASTADLAIFLMLAALRDTTTAALDLREGRWTSWGLDDHLGADLTGATVGLVGYGRIGQAVARRLAAFDATVLHHTRTDTTHPGWTPELAAMASRVDVLSLHVPGGSATHHLINEAILAALGDHAVLINTARGSVVDEAALCAALEAGTIAGAGIDVFENEPTPSARLLAAPHLTCLPHIGSATRATRRAMGAMAAAGAAAVLAGERPSTAVT